jgi:hypothetical protein
MSWCCSKAGRGSGKQSLVELPSYPCAVGDLADLGQKHHKTVSSCQLDLLILVFAMCWYQHGNEITQTEPQTKTKRYASIVLDKEYRCIPKYRGFTLVHSTSACFLFHPRATEPKMHDRFIATDHSTKRMRGEWTTLSGNSQLWNE